LVGGGAAPSHALAFLRTCPPDNDPLEFIFGDLAKEFTADEEKVLCALTYFSLPAKVRQSPRFPGGKSDMPLSDGNAAHRIRGTARLLLLN
jgi:hypothetical protein